MRAFLFALSMFVATPASAQFAFDFPLPPPEKLPPINQWTPLPIPRWTPRHAAETAPLPPVVAGIRFVPLQLTDESAVTLPTEEYIAELLFRCSKLTETRKADCTSDVTRVSGLAQEVREGEKTLGSLTKFSERQNKLETLEGNARVIGFRFGAMKKRWGFPASNEDE